MDEHERRARYDMQAFELNRERGVGFGRHALRLTNTRSLASEGARIRLTDHRRQTKSITST
jgi:hypothetical protein